jgi:hypothetical protein
MKRKFNFGDLAISGIQGLKRGVFNRNIIEGTEVVIIDYDTTLHLYKVKPSSLVEEDIADNGMNLSFGYFRSTQLTKL